MTIAEELAKLEEMRGRGNLNDEEFAQAKARIIGGPGAGGSSGTSAAGSNMAAINGMRRSKSDRWIAGVCGGLAKATGMESWLWRLLFCILLVFGGCGLLIYLLAWIFVPIE